MQKMDICEREILDRTLEQQITVIKSLILDMERGKLEPTYVQTMIEMYKTEILKSHKTKFKYWQGKTASGIHISQKKPLNRHMGGW